MSAAGNGSSNGTRRPVGRVLIVRPSALGDVARTVPALATIRGAYPGAEVHWLVASAFADVVRHHPMLDRVVRFDRDWGKRDALPRTLAEGWGFVRRLREPGYDVVYDLQGLARSGFFTRLTGAPRRVGYAGARELGWLGYNVRHAVNGATHAVDRMLALLAADGLAPVRDMRLYLGDEDRAWLAGFLGANALEPGRYVCVAPTARWRSKMWPLDRYAEVMRRLLTEGVSDRLVVLASPSERGQVDRVLRDLGALADRVVLPTTTVGQMMAVLSATRLLVCNDSAPLHIAVGFDRPVVAVYGPTDPAEVGPYGREASVVRPAEAAGAKVNYRAARDDQALIAKVGVEDVWRKIEGTLAQRV